MKTLILNQREIQDLLGMDECIAVMEEALKSVSEGTVIQPVRSVMQIPGSSVLGLMPSYSESLEAAGAKVVTVFPSNQGTEYDAHQGVVLLFETEYGSLRAILDATAITAIRTAAVSGAATKALAPEGASVLGILGAGTQAWGHLEAMSLVRNLERVLVWSPVPGEAEDFARRGIEQFRMDIRPVPEARGAVEKADLICTVTPAKEPILRGEWLHPGMHINAIGACTAESRELDTEAVLRAKTYVDSRASATAEAGDIIIPLHEEAIGLDHIHGEIGEVLGGTVAGRSDPEEITLFKAVGLSVEDLAAARFIYGKAMQAGVGMWVELGGKRLG